MLDPGADITLVKHKEFLYDLKSTSITDIQIQSCSHDHIPCKFKGTLLLKINTKGTIAIPAFYTPSIDHSLISTNDFRCNGLYMNERSNALEDTDGNQQLSFITIHNHGWIPATSFQTPYPIPKVIINAVTTKIPPDLVHKLFGRINVQDIRRSLLNKTFQNLSVNDVDCLNTSTFQWTAFKANPANTDMSLDHGSVINFCIILSSICIVTYLVLYALIIPLLGIFLLQMKHRE